MTAQSPKETSTLFSLAEVEGGASSSWRTTNCHDSHLRSGGDRPHGGTKAGFIANARTESRPSLRLEGGLAH